MKVALFVHCFFPDHFYGTETYTLELARNLKALGHDVTVISAVFQGEPAQAQFVNRYEYAGIPVIAFDKNKCLHRRIKETYYHEDMREPLNELLCDLNPDVVHITHLVNHTAVLLEVVKALHLPVVATLTDFFGFCYNNKLEADDGALCAGPNAKRTNCIACYMKAAAASPHGAAIFRALKTPMLRKMAALRVRTVYGLGLNLRSGMREMVGDLVERPGILHRAYANYDAMIAPTAFLRSAYESNGFRADRLHLSRFGVDIDRAPKPMRAPGEPLTIGFVGQLAPHKGTDLLLKAAQAMPADSLRLKIYGPENQDPVYMAQLRAIAGAETEFLGTFAPDRMAEIMAGVDMICIPSTWYENSPLVLLYALATHTPVLVSDVQGLTEFIEEGVSGWRFKRGDLTHLTAVLRGLVADPEAVRAAGRRTEYTRTTRSMTEDVVALYEKVRTPPPI